MLAARRNLHLYFLLFASIAIIIICCNHINVLNLQGELNLEETLGKIKLAQLYRNFTNTTQDESRKLPSKLFNYSFRIFKINCSTQVPLLLVQGKQEPGHSLFT